MTWPASVNKPEAVEKYERWQNSTNGTSILGWIPVKLSDDALAACGERIGELEKHWHREEKNANRLSRELEQAEVELVAEEARAAEVRIHDYRRIAELEAGNEAKNRGGNAMRDVSNRLPEVKAWDDGTIDFGLDCVPMWHLGCAAINALLAELAALREKCGKCPICNPGQRNLCGAESGTARAEEGTP
jgi:hypothetical protein